MQGSVAERGENLGKTVARLRSRRCSAAQAPALSLTEGHPTGGRQEGRPGSVGVGLAGGRGRRGRGGGEEGRPFGACGERKRGGVPLAHTHDPPSPLNPSPGAWYHPFSPSPLSFTRRRTPPGPDPPSSLPPASGLRGVAAGFAGQRRAREAEGRRGGGRPPVFFSVFSRTCPPPTQRASRRHLPAIGVRREQLRQLWGGGGGRGRGVRGREGEKRGHEAARTESESESESAHAERARRAAPSHRSPLLSLSSPSPDSFLSSPALSPTQQ